MKKYKRWIITFFFVFCGISTVFYLFMQARASQAQSPAVRAKQANLFEVTKGQPTDIVEKIIRADALGEKILQAITENDYAAYRDCFSNKARGEADNSTEEKFAQLRSELLEKGGKYLGKEAVHAEYIPPAAHLIYHGNFEKNRFANLIQVVTEGKKGEEKVRNFTINYYVPEQVEAVGAVAKMMLKAVHDGDEKTFVTTIDEEMKVYLSKPVFDQLRAILKAGVPEDYSGVDIERKFKNVGEKQNGMIFYYHDQTSVGQVDLMLGVTKEVPYKINLLNMSTLSGVALERIHKATDDFLNGLCKNDPELFNKHLDPTLMYSPATQEKFTLLRGWINASYYQKKSFVFATYSFQQKLFGVQYNVLFPGSEDYSMLNVLVQFDSEENPHIVGFDLKKYIGNIYDQK